MATAIRLKRMGAKKEASYRIIVTDAREGTSGASIERLGTYNPRTQPSWVRIDAARTIHWLREGAEPSDTVRSILRKTGVWKQFVDGVEPEAIEDAMVEVGPPPGERGTSQRPAPVDRAPKQYDEPAPEPEPEPAVEEPAAEADEAPEAEAEEAPAAEAEAAEEAPADEAAEEPVAEAVAEEAPAAEAEAAEETAEAEAADEAPADEAPAEATAEAEEAEAEEAEAESDADAEDEEKS